VVELRHIRYFVAVAELRSFSRAAERLMIAQSPLSQQIRKLERELGVRLFGRTSRSVALTHAGKVFYERVRRLPEAGEEAGAAARRAAVASRGGSRSGSSARPPTSCCPAWSGRTMSATPRSRWICAGRCSPRLSWAAGRLAGGRRAAPPTQAEGVVVEVLRQEKLVALLPVQHPLAGERAVRLAALSGEWFLSHPG
jgi:DNA-binding transcriptional LysR family regulator